jgi:hypothetical protein
VGVAVLTGNLDHAQGFWGKLSDLAGDEIFLQYLNSNYGGAKTAFAQGPAVEVLGIATIGEDPESTAETRTVTQEIVLRASIAGSAVSIVAAAKAIYTKRQNGERVKLSVAVFKVFLILLGVLDFITDMLFTYQCFDSKYYTYAYVSLGMLVGSFLIGVVVVFGLLRDAKTAVAWDIVFDALPFYGSILLISASNLETMWLLPWDVKSGGKQMEKDLKLYQGFPLTVFVKAAIAMRFVEDIPQLCTQSAFAIQHGADPATVASLVVTVFDLLFKLVTSMVMVNFGHLVTRRLSAAMGDDIPPGHDTSTMVANPVSSVDREQGQAGTASETGVAAPKLAGAGDHGSAVGLEERNFQREKSHSREALENEVQRLKKERDSGWQPALDPASGHTYFYNEANGETSWDDPRQSGSRTSQPDWEVHPQRAEAGLDAKDMPDKKCATNDAAASLVTTTRAVAEV